MKTDRLSGFRTLVVMMIAAIPLIHFCGRAEAGPPCPFHTVEGVSGGAITPMACLVNSEPRYEGALIGKPAVALSYANLGRKHLDAVSITETLGGRIEFGYAANRLGLGDLPSDIRDATGIDIRRSDVRLHHFNLRALAIKEDTCVGSVAMPAVTAGVHFKVNDGISEINDRLGGALSGIGYERANGADFTLTATKHVPPEILGRPFILTAGMRASQAAQLGLLGFGDAYHTTFEGSVVCMPCDRLVLAYEFRQKPDPYQQIPGLIGDEDHWHGIDAAVILSNHTTFCVGYGAFGTVTNNDENGVWWMQLKYEL